MRSDCRYAGAGWRLSYIKITKEGSKHSSIFNLIKVKAIVTLNDSVAAEFSLNSDIVFGGFELK